MSYQQNKEPTLDKATSRALGETLVGEKNYTVKDGNWIVQKSRVISGNMYRLFGLLDHYERIGLSDENLKRVAGIRNSVAGNTIGFSTEIYPFGMRGEALAALTQQSYPKREYVANSTGNILRREQPETETQGENTR